MDQYLEAEKRLAELKGWDDVRPEFENGDCHFLIGRFNRASGFEQLPKWTHNWNECGPLIIEHQLLVDCGDIGKALSVEVRVRELDDRATFTEHYADHETKSQAVMLTVVKAVVAKLEYELQARYDLRRTNSPSIG